MHVDCKEEQRCAVCVHVAQQPAAVHVTHDVLDRGEGLVDMRRIVHGQNDAGDDLHRQTYRQNDAPDPHPVQVLWRWDGQRGMQ